MTRRLLALFMAILMCFSLLPVGVLAEDGYPIESYEQGAPSSGAAVMDGGDNDGHDYGNIPVTHASMSGVGVEYETHADDHGDVILVHYANRGGKSTAEQVDTDNGGIAHSGKKSIKVNYDFSEITGTEGACLGFDHDICVPGNPTSVGVWVYAPEGTPNLWFRIRVIDGNGTMQTFDLTDEGRGASNPDDPRYDGTMGGVNWTGWKYLTYSFEDSNFEGPYTLRAGETLRIMAVPQSSNPQNEMGTWVCQKDAQGNIPEPEYIGWENSKGCFYVDDLQFVYDKEIIASGYCGYDTTAAYDETSEAYKNLRWTLDSDGTLTVSGTGEMGNTYSWHSYKNSIVSVVIGDGVTSVGEYAFEQCGALTSVSIPDSVKRIGQYAFSECESLRSIVIPDSVTKIEHGAFYGCSSLESIRLSSSIKYLYSGTFSECSSLKDLVIPDNIVFIEQNPFKGCSGLADENGFVIIRGVLYHYCGEGGDVVIPDGVTRIGDYAFYNCSNVTSVQIPAGVTEIGGNSFFGCTSLESIYIPDSVRKIGSAFYGCSKLKNVRLPENAVLENGPFRDCPELTDEDGFVIINNVLAAYYGSGGKVVVPDGVTRIADYAFSSAYETREKITGVILPDSVRSIGAEAFYDCRNLTSINIPDSVESIGEGAFRDCAGLADENGFIIVNDILFGYVGEETELVLPSNVKHISFNALVELNIESLTLNEGLETIADNAILWDIGLTSVNIPKSVRYIGETNFGVCIPLESIHVDPENSFYKDIDGVLFDKSGKTLIAYPVGKTATDYVIPDGVEKIGSAAFAYSGAAMLAGFVDGGLTNITIPHSMKKIEAAAFYYCDKITDVYFKGTESEWAKVTVDDAYQPDETFAPEDGTNATFINACYHFASPPEIIASGYCGGDTNAAFDTLSGTYKNLTWKIDKNGLMTISGNGIMADFGKLNEDDEFDDLPAPWYPYADRVTKIVIEEGVTSIGKNAFYGMANLYDIETPDAMNDIGEDAFKDTPIYEDKDNWSGGGFYIHDTLIETDKDTEKVVVQPGTKVITGQAFWNCKNVTEITLPEGVESIGSEAFKNCVMLAEIEFPTTIKSIGDSAFEGCTALKKAIFKRNAPTDFGTKVFDGCAADFAVYTPCVAACGNTTWMPGLNLKDKIWNGYKIVFTAQHYCYDVTSTTEPTCTESAVTLYTCSFCGDSYTAVVDDPLGHDFGEWTTVKEAKCGEKGSERRDCSRCDVFETRETSALEHTVVIDPAVEPSCTETGLTEGSHCSECHAVIVAQEVIPAKGHTVAVDLAVAPTCTETGLTEGSHCSECHEVLVAQEVVPAKGHSFGEWTVTAQASCLSDGSRTRECACGARETEVLPALDHSYIDTVTEPWCLTDGYTTHVCSRCGDIKVDTPVPALGHNYVNDVCTRCGDSRKIGGDLGNGTAWELDPEGTLSIDGSGMVDLTPENVPWKDHADEVKSIDIGSGINITDLSIFDDLPNLEKINISGSNQKFSSINGVVYNKNANELLYCPKGKTGEYKVHGGLKIIKAYAFANCTKLRVMVIANSITEIGDHAFDGCSSLVNVAFTGSEPKTVGTAIFDNCADDFTVSAVNSNGKWLKSARYDAKTSTWNGYPIRFGEKTIVESDNSDDIRWDVDTYGNLELRDSADLSNIQTPVKTVTVTEGVSSIPAGQFEGFESLEAVSIPESVEEIGDGAFAGCESLYEVSIPAGVAEIGDGVFAGCENLTEINVAEGNPNYKSVDGKLYNKEGTELLCVPAGAGDESYTVPNTVETIGDGAFADCEALSEVTLPAGLTEIGDSAFEGCENLEKIKVTSPKRLLMAVRPGSSGFTVSTIDLPANVEKIGKDAFRGCDCINVMNISANVSEIGSGAFAACANLTKINVDAANENFCSVNGMLLTKDGTTLLCAPAGRSELMLPDTLTSIDDAALDGCSATLILSVNENGPITAKTVPNAIRVDMTGATADRYTVIRCTGEAAYGECAVIGSDNYRLEVNGNDLVAVRTVKVGLSCEPADAGATLTGAGSYAVGDSVTVTAEGNNEWGFAAWVDADGKVVSTEASYSFPASEDITITAKLDEYVAQTDGKGYTTLSAALAAAAKTGGTVNLLKSIDGEDFIVVESGVTLDLNGHSITGAKFIYVTGSMIDSAAVTARGVISASNYFFDKQYQTMTPVFNAEKSGYSLFALEYSSINTLFENGEIKFSLAPSDGERNAAWKLLTGDYTKYFKVVLTVSWSDDNKDNELDFIWNEGYIDTVVETQLKGQGARFTAGITGATVGATAQPKFVICDANGAEIFSFDGPVFTFDGTSWK